MGGYNIEQLVDNLKKKELKQGIKDYSDYVENELNGKRFDTFMNNKPDLELGLIDKKQIRSELMTAINKHTNVIIEINSTDIELSDAGINNSDYDSSIVDANLDLYDSVYKIFDVNPEE